jgi:L-alanine-DL-glutamate epimerase-like enolase superfamily enzyme
MGEHIRGIESRVDNLIAEGTDFVRADVDYDGGITGVMKLAHVAEGFGMDWKSTHRGMRRATAWRRSATPTTTNSAS